MQNVFIIGSKGIPAAYGGYETFVDKLTEYQRQNLNRFTGKKQELEQSRCIVTTHAYFQMMKLDTLDSYEIIIDEDFLVTLFKRNWSLSL
jgi:hypothetical protein